MIKRKILLTGAGAPGGPGIIKALQSAGHEVHAGDRNEAASGRFLTKCFIQLPSAEDDDFISTVLVYCISNNIELVFPLVTKELFAFAKHKALFLANGIKVIVSEYEQLVVANDKGKLYKHLYSQGMIVPDFEIVSTHKQLIDAVKALGYPNVPVCVKPTVSNGSRGVRILQEMADSYDLLFNQKPYNLYTSLKQFSAIIEGRNFPELLVSEYLPGIEFTVDAMVWDGDIKLILPRSRIQMNNGISVRGCFIKHELIISYCHQILSSLQLSGPIGLQVKEAVDGTFKLLEINPRIQGTSTAALGIGINLPAVAVEQEFGPVEIDTASIKWGTSFVKYYEELFY